MDKAWKDMMEAHIYEYLQKVNFTDNDFSLKQLKEELSKITGSTPAVKIKWNTKEKINEHLKSDDPNYKTIIEKAEEIQIGIVTSAENIVNFKFILP